MIPAVLEWIVVLLALVNFGFMLFDGSRGLIKGDYTRPQKGKHAGQLGPWSRLVRAIGIDPESSLMKGIFILWGLSGLIITFAFWAGLSEGWMALLVMSALSLWYLTPGTILSVVQIVLLLVARLV